MSGSGVFSPTIQNAFLNVSTHNGDTLSTAALSLTVTLIDSIFERVVLLLLQLPPDSTETLLRDMLRPDDIARIDALFLGAKNNTSSSAVGPFELTPSLLRARVRDAFVADDVDNDGNSFHDNQSSVARRRALADSALSDTSLLRIAALLRYVTETLLSDALQYAQKASRSSSTSAASLSSSSSMFMSPSVGAEVLPQHVQVACEREPMATLMRIVSTPMASSLATAIVGAGGSISASGRGEIEHRDNHRVADDDDDDDDFDDDLLQASSIVSDTASDAPSGGNDNFPHPLIQTRDPWSSNASQASSSGWMPPSNAPRFTTAAAAAAAAANGDAGASVRLQADDSPLGVARRVWHFIVAEPLGAKHLLCIVILDALLAWVVQQQQ